MTTQENIKAILDTNFTETREDIKERAAENLRYIVEGTRVKEIWVVSHMIPETFSMELKFFKDEKTAKDFYRQWKAQGATCNKYPLIDEISVQDDTVSV